MLTFHLSILTPEGIIFTDNVESLSAPGAEGSFGVLARHAPMMAQLKDGILRVKAPAEEKLFQINSGILEVNNQNNVVILADKAVA